MLQNCRDIADGTNRLACYDAIKLTPAGAPDARSTPEQFGLEQQADKILLNQIDSHIPGHFEGWEPRMKIRLANGQVWQINDDSRRMFDADNPKVTIRRGMMGSFFMDFERLNISPKVKRLQ